jgi:hypothetical protein
MARQMLDRKKKLNEPVQVPISLNREVNGSQQYNDNLVQNKVARNYQTFCPARGLQSIFFSAFHHSFIILVSWTIWIQEQLYFQPSLTDTSCTNYLLAEQNESISPRSQNGKRYCLTPWFYSFLPIVSFCCLYKLLPCISIICRGRATHQFHSKRSGTIYQQTWQQTRRYTGAQLQNANKFCYDL